MHTSQDKGSGRPRRGYTLLLLVFLAANASNADQFHSNAPDRSDPNWPYTYRRACPEDTSRYDQVYGIRARLLSISDLNRPVSASRMPENAGYHGTTVPLGRLCQRLADDYCSQDKVHCWPYPGAVSVIDEYNSALGGDEFHSQSGLGAQNGPDTPILNEIFGSSGHPCAEDTGRYDHQYGTKPIALTEGELRVDIYPLGAAAAGTQRHNFCARLSASRCQNLYWCWPDQQKLRLVVDARKQRQPPPQPGPGDSGDPPGEACRRNPQSYTCLYGRVEEICTTEAQIQAFIDANRRFWDDNTFGITRQLRERLLQSEGAIVDEQAAELGSHAAFASAFIPIPGPAKAKVAISFWEFAKGTELGAAVAQRVKVAADEVWKLHPTLRGEVIERAAAILEYIPKGYEWVGVKKKGWFPYIDFLNFSAREQVSLKSIYAVTEKGLADAIKRMQTHIEILAKVEKQWLVYNGKTTAGECAQAAVNNWKRVLDIRVPKGYEKNLEELVEFGRQYGIEVRITPF